MVWRMLMVGFEIRILKIRIVLDEPRKFWQVVTSSVKSN